MVRAGLLQQVGDELGGDGFPGFGHAVLPRVGEVREHDVHRVREAQLRGLAHEEELEEVLVRVLRARLENVDILPADGFLVPHVPFAAAKRLQEDCSESGFEFFGQSFGE